MRETLFRGKNRFSGKWVYGSLIKTGKYCCILPGDDGTDFEYPYLEPDIGWIDGCATPVHPETVGQWTGNFDKNGRKIFEGDEVVTKYGRHCIVVWFDSPRYCGWDLIPVDTVENINHTKAPDVFDIWKPTNLEVATDFA